MSKNLYLFAVGMLSVFTLFLFNACQGPEVLAERPGVSEPVEDPPPLEPIAETEEVQINTVEIEDQTPVDIPPLQQSDAEPLNYTVKKGDSLWKISRMYGVSVNELASNNNMKKSAVLSIGEVLSIPPGGELRENISAPKKESSHSGGSAPVKREPMPSDGKYVVEKGDSIWKIAYKFNLKNSTLIKANNLNPEKPLQIGQELIIPGGADMISETEESSSAADPLNEEMESDTFPESFEESGSEDTFLEEDSFNTESEKTTETVEEEDISSEDILDDDSGDKETFTDEDLEDIL